MAAMATFLGSNTTSNPTMIIKCPVFTHSGYDSDAEQYYCDYDSWSYGVFAIVAILLILVPVVSVICCIARCKHGKLSRRLTSNVSIDSYATSCEQPLITEEVDHENVVYGVIDSLSPGRSPTVDSASERQSESHDDISVVSSRASLMPNYDQVSLDLKNTKAANIFNNLHNNAEPTDRLGGLLNPENVVSPYASSNVIPNSISSRNNPNSPIYVVPEEASPRSYKDYGYLTTQEPVYAVLENQNELPNTTEANRPDNSNNEIVPNVKQENPLPGPLDSPRKDNVPEEQKDSKEIASSLLDTDTPHSEPLYNILEPTKADSRSPMQAVDDGKTSPEKPVYQSLLNSKDNTSNNVKSNSNEGTESTDEPRYMPLIFPKENDNTSNSESKRGDVPVNADSDPPLPQRSKERTKSRADYQELLLDAINNYAVDERNGCFVLRDSISAPGSKALTVYNKNSDSEQEFYNFKVCFDEAGQVYLAKSTQRFPVIEELLEYLRINKDMLPCTLTTQIL